MKKIITVGLLFLSGAALACTIIDGPSFSINIGGVSPKSIAKDIGGRLQSTFGKTWGSNVSVEGTVYYSVDLPFGYQGGLHSIPFQKPCGKTFQEQADILWPALTGGGGPSGEFCSASGGLQESIVGYSPVYGTAQTCVPGSCTSFTYIKGYEPIYGMTPAADQLGADC